MLPSTKILELQGAIRTGGKSLRAIAREHEVSDRLVRLVAKGTRKPRSSPTERNDDDPRRSPLLGPVGVCPMCRCKVRMPCLKCSLNPEVK